MKHISTLSFLLILITVSLQARENIGQTQIQNQANEYAKLAMNCNPATAITTVSINNMRSYLGTGGDIYYDTFNTAPGVEVPKNGGVYSIFAGAMWLGGLDIDGNLKIAANTYRTNAQGQAVNDFWPGPLNNDSGETDASVCSAYDRHWTVTKSEIDNFVVTGTSSTAIIEWPGKGNPFCPVSLPYGEVMAPFKDVNGDGVYNFQDGDYPDVPGDESVWFVINDNGNTHTATGGAALGFQLNILHYALNNATLAETHFTDYTIINKSTETINKTYLGTWLDPDLGDFLDDYVGCDTTLNLGICYNSDDNDVGGYGTDPPFVALKIINGILGEDNTKIGMSSFVYYNNDFSATGNPETAEEYYGYMTGLWKDGTPITYGGTGYDVNSTDETAFMFPDDPSDSNGWSECNAGNLAGDRRFILATGPFTMEVGARRSITNAILWDDPTGVYTGGNCPNFDAITDLAEEVQTYYDNFVYSDDIPPEITIVGGDVLFMNQLESFTAPDATAIDAQDGDVSSTIMVDESQLDVNTVGVYNVIYTANDLSNNMASRILEVVVQESVDVEEFSTEAHIYPNPVKSVSTISHPSGIREFRLVDLTGKTWLDDRSVDNNSYLLNRGNMNSGIYVYHIITTTNESISGRIIID